MKAIVIGATGKVGSALAIALRAKGHEVYAPTRGEFDLTKPTELPHADVCYLCAAVTDYSKVDPDVAHQTNVSGPIKVADQGRFIVFLSSKAVELRDDAYAQDKSRVERHMLARGNAVVRPGDIRDYRAFGEWLASAKLEPGTVTRW